MAVERTLGADVRRISERVESDSRDVTKALMKDQEATVLFENLNGGKAAGNVFSTRGKIASALGVSKEGIVEHLMDAISSPKPCEIVEDPEFRACASEVKLMSLPVPKYFPEDGGRYITAGVIVVELDGRKNVSFHRMMLMDDRRIAVRLVPRHLFTLYKEAKAAGKGLNVSICVGASAEVLLAAATSMDFGADELEVASAMCLKGHGSPLKVGRCDNGILVPADCDYVMEARITLSETKEGPFVDITGTYDFERQQPVIEVDKVWTRKDPIFHLVLPGGYEHFMLMGLPREPMMYVSVRDKVPGVRSVRLTEGGCCWLNGVVSIKKVNPDDGVKAALAALDGHKSMKNVIVVDDDVNIFDDKEVEWAVATRFQATRIITLPGEKGSSLDPSATDSITCKVAIDATIPLDRDTKDFQRAVL